MAARWVATDVTQPAIKREQQSSGNARRRDDVGVAGAGETFGGDGIDVVPMLEQHVRRRERQVLVELDSHWDWGDGSGTSSYRANIAP